MSNAGSFIDDAPLTRFHKRLTLFAAGGPFLDGFVVTIIGTALITMQPALQLSTTEIGLAGASALIGIFFGGAIFGYVTDLIGRRVMYLIDLAVLIVASVASAFVTTSWQLIALRLLLGVAIGADYPIASSLLAEFTPSRYRGEAARLPVRDVRRRGGGRIRLRVGTVCSRSFRLALHARGSRRIRGGDDPAPIRHTGVPAMAHRRGPAR
jgi:hypothetical protein